ncbi:MAG: hypothetical protein IKT98_09805 [Selenomonadaceae bacterium]|nr:hypothetical protein [Selenomonadaceae bacterium]
MATREEKIKNINAGLELMSDEELDQVAGGTYNNTAADTRALHEMGFDIKSRSAGDCFWMPTNNEAQSDVAKIFSKYGISVDQSWGAVSNKYYRKGKEISRQQAFQAVADAVGKPLPELGY